jgi:hypothetical protein
MKRITLALVTAFAVVLLIGISIGRVVASPHVAMPSPEKLRFQLVGDEPIAGPDGQSIVTGWKVLVFRDVKSGQCYVTFMVSGNPAVADAVSCAAVGK